ncbi:6-phosphogluconate dehydrogenase C-terminal domain-like protein [Hypoxylon cercidicola]|nr:6-phosphogluconate dehydrogenase C-terminal domain-like protein [Hypoxylon cercidicola]
MNFTRWIRTSVMTCSSKPSSRLLSSHASSRQIPAEWLRRVLQDRAEPPRLYAWTLANLPNDASQSEKSPAVGETRQLDDDDERRRIYILGVGNIGRLYASLLAKNASRPPITLVVHRKELLEHWRSQPGIELVRGGKPERNADFDIEWWTDAQPALGPVREPAGIRHLVVATKAADALPQVDRLRRYLGGGSAVAFTQNGMCKLWPPLGDAYAAARFPPPGAAPAWLACVTTHGVTSLGPFRSVHASPADVLVGSVGAGKAGEGDRPSDYLAGQIAGAPGLAGRRVDARALWVAQLEKLVVNAVINPLTAVLRCRNGELFAGREDDGVPAVIDVLLDEASRTLRALVAHPGSDGILRAPRPDEEGETQVAEAGEDEALEGVRDALLERFAFARLRAMLYGVAAKVGENTSSMLQDVRAGKQTEVRDFNGWLVETARYVGGEDARLPAHETLVKLVEDGAALTREELGRHFLGGG